MVDRHARDIAADVVRDFMEGSISNKEYERRYPKSKSDPALWEIYVQIWFFYSDMSKHTLTGKHALNAERRAFLKRCLLFLKSDFEFQWPRQKFRPWYGILRFLGLGREMTSGDIAVWPFFNAAQHEEASRPAG